MKPRKLGCLFYSTAAGDLISAFKAWSQSDDFTHEVAKTYSGELFSVCDAAGARVIALNPGSENKVYRDGLFRIEHVAVPSARGIRYYLVHLSLTVKVFFRILFSRADIAVISDRHVFWWMLSPLRLLGIDVVIALHVRLEPDRGVDRFGRRIFLSLDRWFLKHGASGLLAVSQVIAEEVEEINPNLPKEVFRPLYDRKGFEGIADAAWGTRPFVVLFIGRLREDKGVFDLIEAAAYLKANGRSDLRFSFIGTGPERPELEALIARLGLEEMVTLHGQLTRDPLMQLLEQSSVVVVPTRSDMGEGYNKVAAEAVLCGRPVVTSKTCPILRDIAPAAVEVPVDEWRPLADAIVRLADDREFFERHVSGTHEVREPFFDRRYGYGGAFLRLMDRLGYSGLEREDWLATDSRVAVLPPRDESALRRSI